MDIRASNTKCADSGAARPLAALPLRQPGVDVERGFDKVDRRVWILAVQAGWYLFVPKRLHCFDQAGNASGRIQMSDVGLNGSDGAEAFLLRARAKRLC